MGASRCLLACSLQDLKSSPESPALLPPPLGRGLGSSRGTREYKGGQVVKGGWGTQLSSPSFIGLMPFYPHSHSACLQMKKWRLREAQD